MRRTRAQLDADALRAAVAVLDRYAGPRPTVNVLNVMADSIEAGRRTPEPRRALSGSDFEVAMRAGDPTGETHAECCRCRICDTAERDRATNGGAGYPVG
jgi:hypothetical protein